MLYVAKIDSLKIRLPKNLVQILNPTFNLEYHKMIISTGYLEEEKINLDRNKVDITNGISTRIGLATFMQGETNQEQIFIQVNAKQLQKNYFSGINKLNIAQLYNYLMDLNIIYVNYDVFLQAQCSDVDICFDQNLSPQEFTIAITALYRRILPQMQKYVGKPFRQATNIGLQFNTREKATPGKPHVKLYHKGLELLYHSIEFQKEYFPGEKVLNIARTEFTIKGAKHKQKLKLEFQSLEDLLNIPEIDLRKALFTAIPIYIQKSPIMSRDKNKKISPTDRLLMHFIDLCINNGLDKAGIYAAINIFENPTERSRMKKKIDVLLEEVDQEDRLIINQKSMDFLRHLDLDF